MMENLGQAAEGPRVAVSGALRLARILPLAKVAGAAFIPDLEAVIAESWAGLGSELTPTSSDSVGRLEEWRVRLAGSTDILLPNYYQATAVSVALLISRPGDLGANSVFAKVNANIGNLWNCCDHIIHKAGVERSGILGSLKTTLRDVENQWFDRDIELISSSDDFRQVLQSRLADIERKREARDQIAEAIASAAGWS